VYPGNPAVRSETVSLSQSVPSQTIPPDRLDSVTKYPSNPPLGADQERVDPQAIPTQNLSRRIVWLFRIQPETDTRALLVGLETVWLRQSVQFQTIRRVTTLY